MFSYPVHLTREGKSWLVEFPDIPEALTSGDTVEEALAMAQDALETAMEFYFEDERPVPTPSKLEKNGHSVTLPASMSARILLLNEMVKQEVRAVDLVRKVDVTPQEM